MANPTITFEPYAGQTASVMAAMSRRAVALAVADTVDTERRWTAHAEGITSATAEVAAHGAAPRVRASSAAAMVFAHGPDAHVDAAATGVSPTIGLVYAHGSSPVASASGYTIQGADASAVRLPRVLATQGNSIVVARRSPQAMALGAPDVVRGGAFIPNYPLFGGIRGDPRLDINDRLAMGDGLMGDPIQALLDLFQISDVYAHTAQVLQSMEDGISLADVAAMIWQADLVDSFIATAVGNGMAQLTVMLADAIDVSDSTTSLSTVLAAIRDGFYVTLTLRDGDDVYTAWVMTPENRAMRSYSSWPFNSIATIGGQLFGAADDGLYLLGGDTDAGQAILASIRTGRLSLGNTRLKRIDRAYIGANTAGTLLLKVEATTIAGDRLQQVYRMTPAFTDEPREHRVDVGRGFRSVYWTFELANDTDGADFELHDMQVLPLTLSGRTF